MATDHFAALLDELEGASFRRKTDDLRKAMDNAVVLQFQRSCRNWPQQKAQLAASVRELEVMAKATEAHAAVRRHESFRRQVEGFYASYRESVDAGRLSVMQAIRVEEHSRHVLAGAG